MRIDTHTKQILADSQNNFARRRAWVIYQLKIRGETLASLADKAGVRRQQTQVALSKPYPRMELIIAEALGLPPRVVFPDRYNKDGLPNRRRGRPRKSDVKTVKDSGRARNVSAATQNGHRVL